MINTVPDPTDLEVAITHHIRHGIDRARQQPGGLCLGHDVALAPSLKPDGISALHGFCEIVGHGAGRVHELRVIDEVLAANQAQQTRQAIGCAHDVDVAIVTRPHARTHAKDGGAKTAH